MRYAEHTQARRRLGLEENSAARCHNQMEGRVLKTTDEIRALLAEGTDVVTGCWIAGMPVGRDVFMTVLWTGRFVQVWGDDSTVSMISRREVKLSLCGSSRAKDPNIRQALIDRFGGKETAIGKKASPGPLYGVKGHEWSALALCITYMRSGERQ